MLQLHLIIFLSIEPSKYVFAENSSGFGFSYTPYLSKIVNDVFLGNLTYFRKNSERSAWSFSLKYFSLGEIDILQNPLDIPVIESPNEFTLDAAYSQNLMIILAWVLLVDFYCQMSNYNHLILSLKHLPV